MTIDEHIGVIEDLKSTMSVCMPEPEKTEICTSLGEAIDTMRKYQKLERALDKIRAEMEQEYTKFRNKSDMWNERACGLGTALEIIDKYKAESEDKA